MANVPLPEQMTVGRLRAMLENVPDEAVIALVLPAGFSGDPQFSLCLNIDAAYSGGPVFRLTPADGPQPAGRARE